MANDPASKRQQEALPAAKVQHVTLGDPADVEESSPSTRLLGGSTSKALNNLLANQAIRTLWIPANATETERDRLYTAALAALMAFQPTDAIEGMMAVQAFGLHGASVECLRRAMLPDQPFEAADRLRRQAANLSRAFLDVVAGLDRKRGKGGHQVVRIERVQVAPGAQAIVGNVQTGAPPIGGVAPAPTRAIDHEPPGLTLNGTAVPEPELVNTNRSGGGGRG